MMTGYLALIMFFALAYTFRIPLHAREHRRRYSHRPHAGLTASDRLRLNALVGNGGAKKVSKGVSAYGRTLLWSERLPPTRTRPETEQFL